MRANGIDFSKWAQGYEYRPDSVDFVVHRVAHGITEDRKLAEHAFNSKPVSVRDGYLYYEMDSHWLAQAELAMELAHEHKLDALWWDAEEDQWRNKISAKFLNETAAGWHEFSKEFPGSGIYCNRDVLYHLVSFFGREYMDQIPLWIADPRHNGETIDDFIVGNDEPNLWVYRGGRYVELASTWTYWQTSFLGDPDRYGIIGKQAVDENVFNGTRNELLKLRGKSVIVENVKRLADKVRGNWKGKRIQPR